MPKGKGSSSKKGPIQLEALDFRKIKIRIEGTTSLIMHKMSQKSRMAMLSKQMEGKTTKNREARNPREEFEGGLHVIEDGVFTYENDDAVGLGEVVFSGKIGFPAHGFKAAIVSAARNYDQIPMTQVRGSVFVYGVSDPEFVEIKYKRMEMREDVVTVGNGSSDLRYRPELFNWAADLHIEYNAGIPEFRKIESLLNLINAAGMTVGIAERRPGKAGHTNGMFRIK